MQRGRKNEALKKARKDLVQHLSSKAPEAAIDLTIERVIGLERDLDCIYFLKLSG